ncbi:MAG TPA: M23 family metallopeptidase [Mycobacteriales bacterium]|nr:M23 family metallopeptidase [Mycobacteriales bacterium]
MPSADTTAPSSRLVRLVLLAALAVGLGGLALPSGSSPTQTRPSAVRVEAAALHAPVFVKPVVVGPSRRPARATRSVRRAAWVRPSSAAIVSPYGPRWGRMHWGVDFGGGYGAPIRAAGAGRVIGAGYLSGEGGYGKIVLVRHAGGVVTAYAHMSRTAVRAGEYVQPGEILGLVGSTGHSFGPHLHFEVRVGGAKVSPVPWLRRHGVRI